MNLSVREVNSKLHHLYKNFIECRNKNFHKFKTLKFLMNLVKLRFKNQLISQELIFQNV